MASMALQGCVQTKSILIGGTLGLPGVEYLREKDAEIIDKVCARAVMTERKIMDKEGNVLFNVGSKVCVEWHDRRAQFGVMMGANSVFNVFLIFVNPAIAGAYMGAGALWGLYNQNKMGLSKIEEKKNWTPMDYLKNCKTCSNNYYYQP